MNNKETKILEYSLEELVNCGSTTNLNELTDELFFADDDMRRGAFMLEDISYETVGFNAQTKLIQISVTTKIVRFT